MVSNGEISLTYANGVLKPDQRLNFPEGARLRATIRPAAPDPAAAQRAMDEIRRCSGTQFDPIVVDAFCRGIEVWRERRRVDGRDYPR